MSEPKQFGRRRRRGGMHFKPSGGGPKPGKQQDREAQQARAGATADQSSVVDEQLFERQRYAKEIERSENVAAGLPPEGAPGEQEPEGPQAQKGAYREPNLETPAEVEEEEFQPVTVEEKPRNLIEAPLHVAPMYHLLPQL